MTKEPETTQLSLFEDAFVIGLYSVKYFGGPTDIMALTRAQLNRFKSDKTIESITRMF